MRSNSYGRLAGKEEAEAIISLAQQFEKQEKAFAEIPTAIFQCQDGIWAQAVFLSRLKLNGLDGAFSRRVRHPDLRIDAAVVLFESLPPIVNPSSGIAHPRRVRRGVRQGDHREAELPADRVGQKRLNCPMQLRLETSATRGQRRVPEALVVRVRRICRSPHGLQFAATGRADEPAALSVPVERYRAQPYKPISLWVISERHAPSRAFRSHRTPFCSPCLSQRTGGA